MQFTLRKTFTFEAAHSNPYHEGPCRNVHGHTYTVEVFARRDDGWIVDDTDSSMHGMVIDAHLLKTVWADLHAIVDHANLNDVTPCDPTTIENLAAWFLLEFRERGCPEVFRVRVREGATTSAECER